jgi:hypothetical protein
LLKGNVNCQTIFGYQYSKMDLLAQKSIKFHYYSTYLVYLVFHKCALDPLGNAMIGIPLHPLSLFVKIILKVL